MRKIFIATVVWSLLWGTQSALATGPTLVWKGYDGAIERLRSFHTEPMPITGVSMFGYPTLENRKEEARPPNLQIYISNGAYCAPKMNLLESLQLMNLIASGKDVRVTCISSGKVLEQALERSELEDCFVVGFGSEITPAPGKDCFLGFPGRID